MYNENFKKCVREFHIYIFCALFCTSFDKIENIFFNIFTKLPNNGENHLNKIFLIENLFFFQKGIISVSISKMCAIWNTLIYILTYYE